MRPVAEDLTVRQVLVKHLRAPALVDVHAGADGDAEEITRTEQRVMVDNVAIGRIVRRRRLDNAVMARDPKINLADKAVEEMLLPGEAMRTSPEMSAPPSTVGSPPFGSMA